MKSKIEITKSVKDQRGREHIQHRGGAGSHDSRPKRVRTRNAQKRAYLKEWE